MGKPKGNGNYNQVPGSDGFQRMNFLYQASQIVIENAPECPQLTACYGSQMVGIGKKLQLKMDPSIKRTICKSCKGLLIAGVTASVKIRSVGKTSQKKKPKRKVKTQEWTCLQCHSVRNFVLKSDYMLWSEKCQEMSQ